MKFKVIDNKTGKEADTYDIALNEEWAQSLIYCDMQGFALTEDGDLVLMDECGQVVYCDTDRFKVVIDDERPHGKWIKHDTWDYSCSLCDAYSFADDGIVEDLPNFCPNCGAKMAVSE